LIVRWVAGFARFWYRFIVGDDWTIAGLVALGLIAVSVLARGGLAAWWLMPVVAAAALSLSLWRARGQRV
jgi:hypothetical protein